MTKMLTRHILRSTDMPTVQSGEQVNSYEPSSIHGSIVSTVNPRYLSLPRRRPRHARSADPRVLAAVCWDQPSGSRSSRSSSSTAAGAAAPTPRIPHRLQKEMHGVLGRSGAVTETEAISLRLDTLR